MKLLTLNAHSLLEADYERKLVYFAEYVIREQVDLIALQEVNQSMSAPEAESWLLEGQYTLQEEQRPVRADNHAAWAAFLLRQAGVDCRWAYLPVKRGYGRFDEGLAILSVNREIVCADVQTISGNRDYSEWKRRAILGVRLGGLNGWFYSVHTGWWQDPEEPFEAQWNRMQAHLDKRKGEPVYLMGDFNCPAGLRGEGYDLIREAGWHDLYEAAEEKRGCSTVLRGIDGWNKEPEDGQGVRIDYIFCSRPTRVCSVKTVFDGVNEMRVSDHLGILAEIEEERRAK